MTLVKLAIQTKCTRVVNKQDFMTNSNPLFASNKVLKVSGDFRINLSIHMVKHSNKCSQLLPVHIHNTRYRTNFVPPEQRLSLTPFGRVACCHAVKIPVDG